jgi:hypothetical protein
MAQQPTRHNSLTGTEASPAERWSRTTHGRRPLHYGYPRSSNSLLDGAPESCLTRRAGAIRLFNLITQVLLEEL